MGLPQKSIAFITPEEYLALENVSLAKHEYMDGVVYAWQGSNIQGMAGAPLEHNRICLNAAFSLRQQLQGRPHPTCQVYMSDVRLKPAEASAYFYPDVMLRCGQPLAGNTMEISDAALVVEVLSPSTAAFDRSDKFLRYCCMASLECYVLIDPEKRSIEVYRRDQNWQKPQNLPMIQSAPSALPVESDLGSNARATDCYALGVHGLVFQAHTIFGDD